MRESARACHTVVLRTRCNVLCHLQLSVHYHVTLRARSMTRCMHSVTGRPPSCQCRAEADAATITHTNTASQTQLPAARTLLRRFALHTRALARSLFTRTRTCAVGSAAGATGRTRACLLLLQLHAGVRLPLHTTLAAAAPTTAARRALAWNLSISTGPRGGGSTHRRGCRCRAGEGYQRGRVRPWLRACEAASLDVPHLDLAPRVRYGGW